VTPHGPLLRRIVVVALGAALLPASGVGTFGAAPAEAATGNGGQQVTWKPDSHSPWGLFFYDAGGHQITSGNVDDAPMAACYVASDTEETAGASGTGATTGASDSNGPDTTPTSADSASWPGTHDVTTTQALPAANLPGDLAASPAAW